LPVEVNCNLCDNKKTKLLFVKDSHRINECKICGLIYVNPRLNNDDIASLYDKDYFHGAGFDKSVNYYRDYEAKNPLDEKECLRRLDDINQHIKTGKLLDIGCAFGYFLDVAYQKGWDVYGAEISSYPGNAAKKRYGEKIFIGTLEKSLFSDNYFDVITMIEVIEHFTDPLHILKEARKKLKQGGLLYIQTGNIQSLPARLQGKKWNYLILPGHIYYFSPRTIKMMLESAGFKVLRIIPPGDHENSRLFSFLRNNRLTKAFLPFFSPFLIKILNLKELLFSQGMRIIAQK